MSSVDKKNCGVLWENKNYPWEKLIFRQTLFCRLTLLLYLCNIASDNIKSPRAMISQNVQSMIPKIRHYFGSQPIKRAWLFGSCSRGEETPESDVDILVEYDRDGTRISLMKMAGIMLGLEDLLHHKVDIVEDGRLLPFAQESANRDKFLIYERKG